MKPLGKHRHQKWSLKETEAGKLSSSLELGDRFTKKKKGGKVAMVVGRGDGGCGGGGGGAGVVVAGGWGGGGGSRIATRIARVLCSVGPGLNMWNSLPHESYWTHFNSQSLHSKVP